MNTPIAINLNDLTQAHIDRAFKAPGSCRYSGPCILGALMPAGSTDYEDDWDSDNIRTALRNGYVSMPEDQHDEASAIQIAFDGGTQERIPGDISRLRLAELAELLAKRGLVVPS